MWNKVFAFTGSLAPCRIIVLAEHFQWANNTSNLRCTDSVGICYFAGDCQTAMICTMLLACKDTNGCQSETASFKFMPLRVSENVLYKRSN